MATRSSLRLGAAAAFLLVGCAPTAHVDRGGQLTESTEVGREPSLEVRATARVGDTIYRQYAYTKTNMTTLQDGYSSSIGLAKIEAPKGTILTKASALGRHALCTAQPTYFALGEARPVCFFDDDGDGKLEKVWIVGTLATFVYEAPQLAYEQREVAQAARGFSKELIYQGREGLILKVAYREHLNDLARPAFSQDLSYEMSKSGPTEIVFRNVELTVTEVGNNKIAYVVHTEF